MGHGLDAQNRKNEIEVQFSYDMPDAYLYTTSNEGKVGQWTYNCLLYTSPSPRD